MSFGGEFSTRKARFKTLRQMQTVRAQVQSVTVFCREVRIGWRDFVVEEMR